MKNVQPTSAGSAAYQQLLATRSLLHEPVHGDSSPGLEGELALQAKFYGGEFGEVWKTLCGREVRLLDPGEWNREAGPDFRGITILVDGEERLRGDLEIDLHAAGWEQHGHAVNPDFENVVLHLFFQGGQKTNFARTTSHRAVLQVQLDAESREDPSPLFAGQPIRDPDAALPLIKLAARHRLAKKAARFGVLTQLQGAQKALFQGVAAALGYRGNSVPMTLLAQRTGVRASAAPDGQGLLFGLAGFLHAEEFDLAPEESRTFLRSLWEAWWKVRDRECRLVLPPKTWKLSSSRPANHPHRRIATLSLVARAIPRLLNALEKKNEALFGRILTSLEHPFWSHHWNLRGASLPEGSSLALLGDSRKEDILINVFCPMLTLRGTDGYELLCRLEPGQIPRRIRELADWFCPELTSAMLRSANIQQGLLQLGADFRGQQSPLQILKNYHP